MTAPTRVRPVQEHVVRTQEPGAAGNFNSQAEDGATVDGARVRVLRAKGGDGCAGAVETLLGVGLLECGVIEEFLLQGEFLPRGAVVAAIPQCLLAFCEELARRWSGDES
jgi:hypothetical protein